MKIIDCFKFFNEIELLHLRFMEYYDVVDYFVLVEATKSHTGKPKELVFDNNKSKFSKYLDKVVHVVVDDLPDYSVNDIWKAENYQRNCISRGLEKVASKGDKIIISDCDELWDVNKAKNNLNRNDPVTFHQDLFYYYVNCKQKQTWDGSIMATYGMCGTPQQLRDAARNLGVNRVYPGGWHYSFMGGADRIRTKVENIAESHYIIDKIGNVDDISKKMNTGEDLWGRQDDYAKKQFISLTYKPAAMDEFIKLYPHFYKENV